MDNIGQRSEALLGGHIFNKIELFSKIKIILFSIIEFSYFSNFQNIRIPGKSGLTQCWTCVGQPILNSACALQCAWVPTISYSTPEMACVTHSCCVPAVFTHVISNLRSKLKGAVKGGPFNDFAKPHLLTELPPGTLLPSFYLELCYQV